MKQIVLDKNESSLLLVCKGWSLKDKLKKETIEPFGNKNKILDTYKEFAYEHANFAGIPIEYVQLKDIVVYRMLPLVEKFFEKGDLTKMMINMCEWNHEENTPIETLFLVLRHKLFHLQVRSKLKGDDLIVFDKEFIKEK